MLICVRCGDPILDHIDYEKVDDEGIVCELCLDEEAIMNEDEDDENR